MYQILQHALADKSNKTKFTLLFSNVTEKDILLREEFDSLAKKYPDTFKVVYYLDKGERDWKGVSDSAYLRYVHSQRSGETRYISKEGIQKYVAGADSGNKVKVFVCGKLFSSIRIRFFRLRGTLLGPPGQVASLAGKKDGMKQGELGGILKELGYTEDQVYKF